nr:carboxypeptidase regulatory-like domain-containing protein [Bacteroidota bacterium]
MKKLLLFTLIAFVCNFTFSQTNLVQVQKAITDPIVGYSIEKQLALPSHIPIGDAIVNGSSREIGVNWNFTDPVAIGSRIKVSSNSGFTLNSWWLNDERVSLYENSSVPNYEVPIVTDWEYPIDMTEDGLYWVVGYDSIVQVYSTMSSTFIWEMTFDATITGVKISQDGSTVYVVENNFGGQDKTYVASYQVGSSDPDWETSFVGLATTFAASGDRSVLVFCQYSGVNKMWVMNSENGEVIFDAYYKNQNPPALSYDGKIILNGDYSGYAYLYEYDDGLGTYYEKWNFKVGGGGTSAWVVGMGVSADGSTAAIGTLVFLSTGYDGEIYTFNTYSPEPLWVFEHCGDEILSIDLSDDGSLIAAAGWGPLDHSKPDFYIFRKQSNDPLFSITTQGSFNTMDLSADGTFCSVSGKAVHAREFGSGGILYNVNSDPGGGTILGTVEDQGSQSLSGVKIAVDGLDDYFAYSNQDGHYEIKYVPEGIYAVTGSKVGYYPETVEDVPVVEGQATEVGYIMESTGNPPFDLMATQGAYNVVHLDWDHPSASEIEG